MIYTNTRDEIENLMLVAMEQGADLTDLLDIVESIAYARDETSAADIAEASRAIYHRGRLTGKEGQK